MHKLGRRALAGAVVTGVLLAAGACSSSGGKAAEAAHALEKEVDELGISRPAEGGR